MKEKKQLKKWTEFMSVLKIEKHFSPLFKGSTAEVKTLCELLLWRVPLHLQQRFLFLRTCQCSALMGHVLLN